MLSWTSEAAALVRALAGPLGHAPCLGVRISVDPGSRSLRMSAADGPGDRDTVLTREGARLFLSPDAVARLRGARLHADLGSRRTFLLDPEPRPRSWLSLWTWGLVT